MKIVFLPLAEQELQQAITYYEEQLKGLGRQFFNEIDYAINLIKLFPSGWHKIDGNARKCIVKRFPYLILYHVEKDQLVISAIAHQHRNPVYYLKRKVSK